MRELYTPTRAPSGFKDSQKIRVALDEMTDISRMRSRAHEQANLFRDFYIQPGSSRERQLRGELDQARGVLARWAVVTAYEEFLTVDLARIENVGDWDAAAEAETDVGDVALELFMNEQIDGMIEHGSPEAKLSIVIDPGLVTAQGLIAVRRKRLLLATPPLPHEFTVRREPPVSMMTDASMEIGKVSEFVLDFDRLEMIDPKVAQEILLATSGGISPSDITQVEGVRSAPAVIEAAIRDRDAMLTPAATTYYADRKYQNARRVEARSAEWVS